MSISFRGKSRICIALLCMFVLFAVRPVRAQDRMETESLKPDTLTQPVDSLRIRFQEGVELYNAERYWDALNVFEDINAVPASENHLLSASGLMLMKTYLRLGDLDRALQLGREFVLIHQNSAYSDDAEYVLGEAYLYLGAYEEAVFHYLNVMKVTEEERLRYLSKQTAETIIDLFIDAEQLEGMRDGAREDFHQIFLTLKLAEKLHTDGEDRQAQRELRSVRNLIKGYYFNREYVVTTERLKDRAREKIYIGILLPLSGPYAAVGKSLLNGVRYALHQFRMNYDKEIAGIVMDNRGEIVESIKKIEYLCNNPKIRAIFGPVQSENAIAVAAVANQCHIPMITPTANSSELSSLGPYVFQANVDFENLGRFLGLYGTNITDVKTVATISPADEFGKEMTDSFCRAIDEAGGRIVSQQWYRENPEDLKFQFSNVREAGLDLEQRRLNQRIEKAQERLFQYTVSDSLWFQDSIMVSLEGDRYRILQHDTVLTVGLKRALILTGLMDSTEFRVPKQDSIEYSIGSIDAILIPAYASDLKVLIPQLEYYNIRAQVFGSANWNDLQLLKDHPAVARRLVFITDYYIDTESSFYTHFERFYSRLLGEAPNRFDLYGYDTMRALLTAFDNTELSREEIRKRLAHMPTYHGICRNISFRGNRPRINSCAFIMKVRGDQIEPIAAVENGDIIEYEKRY